MNIPLLLIHFNRPEHTRRQLDLLRPIAPKQVWVLCDGPREGRTEEVAKVAAVRAQLEKPGWQCQLHFKFEAENKGVYANISEGISWFLNQAGAGIILEDDILPSSAFFEFCEAMLERYAENSKVFSISGFTGSAEPLNIPDSYCFSRYFSCWGWATWKRAWDRMDHDLMVFRDRDTWQRVCQWHSWGAREKIYWRLIGRRMLRGKVDSWAYRFLQSLWLYEGYGIFPRVNLAENAGFGAAATNTNFMPGMSVPAGDMRPPYTHPSAVRANAGVDRWIESTTHSKSLTVRAAWVRARFAQRFGAHNALKI